MKKLRRVLAITMLWYLRLGPLVKLATALTVIVGAGTAVYQFYSTITAEGAHREAAAALIKQADSELQGKDYALAWDANAKALELAPQNAAALAQQARIAMAWLEDVRMSSKPGATKFGDIVVPLQDALIGRSTQPAVRGTELADIKAHIGWARFLRSRDGVTGLRISEAFAEALQVDPNNMYGHVMKGFFILWQGGRPQDARADFDAALQSQVDPPYRDHMILAALLNSDRDEYRFAAIEYANKIRKGGRTIDAESQRHLLWFYETGLNDIEYLTRLSRIIPLDEHMAMLDWMLADLHDPQRRGNDNVLRAWLMEQAGRKPEALALYQELVATTSPQSTSRAAELARSGIRRLSGR